MWKIPFTFSGVSQGASSPYQRLEVFHCCILKSKSTTLINQAQRKDSKEAAEMTTGLLFHTKKKTGNSGVQPFRSGSNLFSASSLNACIVETLLCLNRTSAFPDQFQFRAWGIILLNFQTCPFNNTSYQCYLYNNCLGLNGRQTLIFL